MTMCPNCKKELEEGTKFCDDCGAPTVETESAVTAEPVVTAESTAEADPAVAVAEPAGETIFCPSCGARNGAAAILCEKCGAPLGEESPADGKEGPKKGSPKKALLLGGIVVVAVVLIALAVMLLGGGKKGDYVLYIKDIELNYTSLGKKPMEVTSRLLSDKEAYGSDLGKGELGTRVANDVSSYIAMSEDGKRLFFPDKVTPYGDGVTLYYRDVGKAKAEPEKLDSNVYQYAINAKGTQVVYRKTDGTLYFNDLKDKEKIDSNTRSFYVTEDLKKVGYLDESDTFRLYYPNSKKEEVKLARDVYNIEYVSDDLSTLYYTKQDSSDSEEFGSLTLYKQEEGKEDKEKLASNVERVVAIYDSGEVYYLTVSENAGKTLMDYVDDDLAAADAALTEPEYPTYPAEPDYPDVSYPSWWDYDTDEEYEAARAEYDAAYEVYEKEYEAWKNVRDQMYEEYQSAQDNYYSKQDRDYLRDYLRESTVSAPEYTLHYFDGKTDTVVTETLKDRYFDYMSYNKAVLVASVNDPREVTKTKFSELYQMYQTTYDYYYVGEELQNKNSASAGKYIVVGAALTAVEDEDATYFRLTPDGSAVYYMTNISGEEGELYKIPLDKGVGAPESVDSDVYANTFYFPGGKPLYFKDVREQAGDLFWDGAEVDSDVYLYSCGTAEDDTLLYLMDYKNGEGTLRMFKNGKAKTVADDVYNWYMSDAGTILYLDDYSTKSYTGTLNQYKGGKAKEIDSDVAALVYNNTRLIKGGY